MDHRLRAGARLTCGLAACDARPISARRPVPATGVARSAPAATPAPAATSAFCLDLTTFQVGVLVWRNDVVTEVKKRSPDLKGLRQRAVMIEYIGAKMRKSASASSSARCARPSPPRPRRYGRDGRPVTSSRPCTASAAAFDAVDAYEGCPKTS
ncbi:hypothetical protein GCM10022419_082720 [Nonomuraea rosea]|uniref:Uncharacterized protein n=1 Tax=Nonomuraea rosea TaxID=638574 RepID=A0ABP6YQV0_9ACTN